MKTRERRLPTPVELEALWRPDPAFIGPVAPPMWLWVRGAEAKRARQFGLRFHALSLEGF